MLKKKTADGVVAMAFSKSFEAKSVIDQHFSVYKPGDVGFSLDM